MPCSCCHQALRSWKAKRCPSSPVLAHALHHVVPAAALPVAADCGHHLGDLARQRPRIPAWACRPCMRIRFQAIFRLWPTTPRFCCHMWCWSCDQSSKNFSCTNGLLLVVGEVLGDGVEGVFEHLGVALFAGRQPQVDQVGRRVVAHRVPVLLALVGAQRLAARVQRDRVEVREVAALLLVQEEAVEQVDRQLGVAAGCAGRR